MVDIRGFNGGLNTDASPELLPNGDYTYAMNIENTAEGIINTFGNRPLQGIPNPISGSEWVCGSFYDKKRQRLIYFLNNSDGYHRIVSFDAITESSVVLFNEQSNQAFTPVVRPLYQSNVANFVYNAASETITIKDNIQYPLKVGDKFLISGDAILSRNITYTVSAITITQSLGVFTHIITVVENITSPSSPGTAVNVTYSVLTQSITSIILGWQSYLEYNPIALIKDIKVIHREYEGDLYYFIDPNKRLLKFNYDTLLDWTTNQVAVSLDYFKVIKAPPKDVLSVDVFDDTDYKINNLYKKLFQFKYRFVYDDNEKSVWSAISKIPLTAKSTDPAYNALSNVQNAISIKLTTGDINVAKIEIAGRVNIENEWSDFFLVDTIDKDRDGVSSNIVYDYIFRNDSVYTAIDIQESNLLFDYVPDESNALELANGNTLVVGGLKDGYNRDTVLDVVVTNAPNQNSPAALSTLNATTRNPTDTNTFQFIDLNTDYSFGSDNNGTLEYNIAGLIKFDGTPQVGDTITVTLQGYNEEKWFDTVFTGFKFTKRPFNDSWSILFRPGWSINDLVEAFYNHPNLATYSAWNVNGNAARPSKPFFAPNTTPLPNSLYFGALAVNIADRRRWVFESVNVSIKRSFSFIDSDVFPTYKWSGLYRFGLVYYSKDGKTNGVFTNDSMMLRTGKYDTDLIWTPSGSPVIIPENETAQIYIGHEPPPWADYYHIVRTKDLSCDFSLMVLSRNVQILANYINFNIQNIPDTNQESKETSKIINYGTTSFVDGDRIRILQKYSAGAFQWTDKDFIDLPILSVETISGALTIKVKKPDINYTQNPNIITIDPNSVYLLEIYRPAKVLSNEDLVYYEVGYKYNILTDIAGNRYHEGQNSVLGAPSSAYTETVSCEFQSATSQVQIFPATSATKTWASTLKSGDTISVSGTASNNNLFVVSGVAITTLAVNIFFSSPAPTDENSVGGTTFSLIANPNKNYAFIDMFGDGDYYFKTRTMRYDGTAGNFGAFFVADKNFSETYLSAVWSQGRPLIVDENIKEEYYPAMLRFSQSYIYGTNINNISRFYPNNFEEADASFGDILRLKTRENFIRMFQRFKTGMIPIYRQIIIDNAQSSQVALSERLLNKPNYYAGEYGIDKYGSSLISSDYGDYFVDTTNKAIVRVSLDGMTNITDSYNMMTWANESIFEDSYGYGCFNYESRCVIMFVGRRAEIPVGPGPALIEVTNEVISYNEGRKKFDSFYSYNIATAIHFINGYLHSFTYKPPTSLFQTRYLYKHDDSAPLRNTFFESGTSSEIRTVFNGNVQLKKTYIAIEELSTSPWIGNMTTGPLTEQFTSITEVDFQTLNFPYITYIKENKFNASIKRNMNYDGKIEQNRRHTAEAMKGLWAEVYLFNTSTAKQRLISVSLKYIPSPLTNS